jgi:hypothetical protein
LLVYIVFHKGFLGIDTKSKPTHVSIIYSGGSCGIIANNPITLNEINKKFGEKTAALIFAAL